jgi:hypothetical protein
MVSDDNHPAEGALLRLRLNTELYYLGWRLGLHYADNISIMETYKGTKGNTTMTTTIFIIAIVAVITGMISD